ncbi:hypothetical protein TNCV_4139231 [Trichonephila clavipes]|nr:hypothetical protein TNCV_4139231 [Trichonephila clavipes]
MACERKLIESEATTGFFVLLGTKGKKETLEWCMKANLIASRYECPRFKKNMRLQERKGTVDGYEWRCRNLSKDNRHDVVRSRYWARTRDKASHGPIPLPLGYRGHITELEVKLKKIDHLQRKIEELKELLFGLETAKPTEEAEYKCETRLDDLEVTEENGLSPPAELPVLTNPGDRESNVVDSSTQNTVLSSTASQHRKNVLISTGSVFLRNNEG